MMQRKSVVLDAIHSKFLKILFNYFPEMTGFQNISFTTYTYLSYTSCPHSLEKVWKLLKAQMPIGISQLAWLLTQNYGIQKKRRYSYVKRR